MLSFLQSLFKNKEIHACLVATLVIIAANGAYLFITNQNPLLQRSALPLTNAHPNILRGQNTLDPNDGFTSQALGVEAMNQFTHGSMPLWNHLEGVGVPLAGGMQSAALFPYTLLQLLPAGSLLFHVALELTAAYGMYFLLRKLRVNILAAAVGAMLFGLNGTFSWLTNAAFNPIAFLSWLILGVELARSASIKQRIGGVITIATSLALSLYAGFPETAYLDGLLVFAWALVRLGGLKKPVIWRYVGSIVLGGLLGLLLAAPILIAFVTYLSDAYTGGHGGSGFSGLALPYIGIPALVMPYIFGPIMGFGSFDQSAQLGVFWGNVGGYLTLGAVVLGLFGAFAKKSPRGLRILLVLWVLVACGRMFGVPVITQLVDHIPAISMSAVFRYVTPSISFAVAVLAALGFQALVDTTPTNKIKAWIGAGCLVVLAVTATVAVRYAPHIAGAPRYRWWLFGSIAIAVVLTIAIMLLAFLRKIPLSKWLVAGIVIAEALILFVIPQLSAPVRPANVDTASVRFLQRHLGESRFYTLGPIAPNYGSYYGIASINNNDLPIPKLWADHINRALDDNTEPILFIGNFQKNPTGHTPQDEFFDNLTQYSNDGVKYLVTLPNQIDKAKAHSVGLTLVYSDAATEIYQLPTTKPYITTAPACETVNVIDRDNIKTDCAQPGSLTRLELFFPGWSATVNGKDTSISQDGIFQKITVPKGPATIKFTYAPHNMPSAILLFWLGIVAVGALMVANVLEKWYKLMKNNE